MNFRDFPWRCQSGVVYIVTGKFGRAWIKGSGSASSPTEGSDMTMMRRLLALSAFLGAVAVISTTLQGQQGKKSGADTSPQTAPAKQVSQLADAVDSRFGSPGVLTYQPLKGDAAFALKLQPKLDTTATPQRPRDLVIVMSTSATQ